MDEFFLSLVEMDSSITQKHLRCLRETSRYYWQSLWSSQFTNTKAFLLGIGGLKCSSYMMNGERLSCMSYSVFNGLWWMSLATVFFEGWGLFVRLIRMYEIYYPLPLNINVGVGISTEPCPPDFGLHMRRDYPDA